MFGTLMALSLGCASKPVPVQNPLTVTPTPAAAVQDTGSLADVLPPAPVVEPEVVTPTVSYTLRRGETLAHFARWSGLPLETVAETSGLSVTDDLLPVGTTVILPVDDEGRARVEAARDAHHQRRAQGWLAARGGEVGTEFHRVKSGESAWTIASQHGELPVWVVESYNPAVDLEHLRPGQELMLPVVADFVASDDLH